MGYYKHGALMIAKNLKNFELLSRRTVRVIWYRENSRLDAIRELLANAVESGYIKAMDSDTAPRYKKYIPYWA